MSAQKRWLLGRIASNTYGYLVVWLLLGLMATGTDTDTDTGTDGYNGHTASGT
jgi:hypothetical protein